MSILLSFLPFITFAVLQDRIGSSMALLIAAAVALALLLRQVVILHKSVKILEGGSMILFGLLAAITRFPHVQLSVVGVRLWVDIGLLAVVIGSMAIGKPFTLQYAREQVSEEIAQNPIFMAVNVKITAVWALAFGVIVATDLAMLYMAGFTAVMGTVAHFAALGGAAAFTVWLPKATAKAASQASQPPRLPA